MTINPVSTTQDSAAPVVYERAGDVGSNRLVASLITMAERVVQDARHCGNGAEYMVNHEHIDDLAIAVRDARAVIPNAKVSHGHPTTQKETI